MTDSRNGSSAGSDGDLVIRCQEVLGWHKTGLLNGGKGGRLRALADQIEASGTPDHYALSLAEKQTADEAMEVVATGDAAQPAVDTFASDIALTHLTLWLDEQIAQAASQQQQSYAMRSEYGQRQGERWHARQVALYETKLKVQSCGAELNRHSGAVEMDKRAEQSNPGGGHEVTENAIMKQMDSEKPLPDEPTPAAGGQTEDWPPLKMALWRVLMDEQLNDGHYIKAFDLIEKLYGAAEPHFHSSAGSDEHSAAVSKVIWRHKKRGTTYQVVTHFAALQCASDQETEDRFKDMNWTIYRSREDGATYIRLTSEFMDGRFERIGSDERHVLNEPQSSVTPGVIERMVTGAWDDSRKQTIEEAAKVADDEAGLWPVHIGSSARVSAQKIRALQEADDGARNAHSTLWGMISAVYGNLDAEDCKWVDREWAKMRGYILPTDGTSTLSRPVLLRDEEAGK